MKRSEDHEPGQGQEGLSYTMSYKDVVDLLEVMDSSPCCELHVELGDLRLTVVKRGNSE